MKKLLVFTLASICSLSLCAQSGSSSSSSPSSSDSNSSSPGYNESSSESDTMNSDSSSIQKEEGQSMSTRTPGTTDDRGTRPWPGDPSSDYDQDSKSGSTKDTTTP